MITILVEKEWDPTQGSTYLFKVLSWKFILLQPYVRWIKMKTYSPTNFPSPQDNLFPKTTEKKFIVWNYHFSGRTTIYLFEFSNINCRIKYMFQVNNGTTRRRSGVFIVKGTLSGLRQFLATESPLKVMKNAFYSTRKLFSFSRYWRFWLEFLVIYQMAWLKRYGLLQILWRHSLVKKKQL